MNLKAASNMRHLFSFIVVLFWSIASGAQPQTAVFSIQVDANGLLYAGSQEGLLRYNGNDWYPLFPTQPTAQHGIEAFQIDGDRAWLAKTNGLWQVSADNAQAWLENLHVTALARPTDSASIYVGTRQGAYQLDPDATPKLIAPELTVSALLAHQQNLIIGAEQGLWLWQNQQLLRLSSDAIKQLARIKDIVWATTAQQGLLRIDPVKHTVERFLETETLSAIAQGDNEQLWLGNARGDILLFDTATQSLQPHTYIRSQHNRIHSLAQDSSRALWVGNSTGIEKLVSNPFRQLSIDQDLFVATHADDDEGFYIASPAGIARVDRVTLNLAPITWTARYLAHSNLTSAYKSDAYLWLANQDKLLRFDLGNQKLRTLSSLYEGSSTAVADILSINETKDGQLLLSTDGAGLIILDPATEQTTLVQQQTHTLASNEVLTAKELSDGKIWIATGNGYAVYDPAQNKLQNFQTREHDPIRITDLSEQGDTVWLTTYGHGLWRVSKQNPEQVTIFTVHEQLPSQYLMGVRATENNLWLLSRTQIMAWQPPKLTTSTAELPSFTTYPQQPTAVFNVGALNLLPNGSLIALNDRGLLLWDSQTTTVTANAYPAVFTDIIYHDDKNHTSSVLSASDRITLQHPEDTLQISFTSLNYAHSEQSRFRYRLHEDAAWTYLGAQHTLTLTHLSSGHYALQIQAGNAQGQWHEQLATLDIDATRPWWQMLLWVIAGFVAAGTAGGAYYVFQRRGRYHNRDYSQRLQETLASHHARLAYEIESKAIWPLSLISELHPDKAAQVLEDVRTYLRLRALEWRLGAIRKRGLHPAINLQRRQYPVKINYTHSGDEVDHLPPAAKVAMYEVFLKLTGQAKQDIDVRLTCNPSHTILHVTGLPISHEQTLEIRQAIAPFQGLIHLRDKQISISMPCHVAASKAKIVLTAKENKEAETSF